MFRKMNFVYFKKYWGLPTAVENMAKMSEEIRFVLT